MIKKQHSIHILYKISQYFPEQYERYSGNIKIVLNLSNYPIKADLKGATGVDTSNLASKSHLASLKAELDKIDIVRLKSVPGDLSKRSNVVDNDVVRELCMIN